MNSPQPIYLFADSQLLFWKSEEQLFLQTIKDNLDANSSKAAYIGASNGDQVEYFEIFKAAMASIGITDCKMVSAFYNEEEQNFIDQADIILLAGGDVALGLKTFKAVGLDQAIRRRYQQGALLIGVSAGAVQLGMGSYAKNPALQIIPLVIAAHEEQTEWQDLKQLLSSEGGQRNGVGIPKGAGLVFYPDHSVEPIRYPLQEYFYPPESDNDKEAAIVATLIYPKTS